MRRDFNDYQFFVAVVQNKGFSAGARALGIPKSRISRRVAELEQRLGVRLLDRTTRGIRLTEVGRQVFQHAHAAVIEADAAEEAAMLMQQEPRGLVRVSCPIGLARTVAAVLPGLLKKNPRLRLQVVVTDRRVDLIHDEIDIAIRVRERLDTDADLQLKRIGLSKRILVASPAFLVSHGAPASPADLATFQALHQNPSGPYTWQLTSDRGDITTVAVEPLMAAGGFEFLIEAACQGAGIGLLPMASCCEALASGALVRVLPAWSGIDGILHVVFVSRRGMLPSIRTVIDCLTEALRSEASD